MKYVVISRLAPGVDNAQAALATFMKVGVGDGTEATYAVADGKTFINIIENDSPDMTRVVVVRAVLRVDRDLPGRGGRRGMAGVDPGGPRQLGVTFDVVIVGGGIAGSALAAVLAPTGMSVLVLERQVAYRDRVRGETMTPWGAAEVQRLGLEDVFLGAGGGYCSTIVPYDEGLAPADAEANAVPVGMLVPGVPGSLNVGHPQASEALAAAAASRGATVVRGIGDVEVEARAIAHRALRARR